MSKKNKEKQIDEIKLENKEEKKVKKPSTFKNVLLTIIVSAIVSLAITTHNKWLPPAKEILNKITTMGQVEGE